jgi:hypothetical protein
MLRDVFMEFQRARFANDGNTYQAAFAIESQSRIDALLKRHGHTRESWDALRRTVEAAIRR